MADLKISEMTPASALSGEELVPLVQSGSNRIATTSTVRTYVREIPQTAAELAAGVTPTDKTRLPGDLLRYGFGTAASAALNAAAFNNACLANSFVFCDEPGTYVCSDVLRPQSDQTIRLAQGVTLQPSVKVWNSPFVRIDGMDNIEWSGGVLDGNKSGNPTGTIIGMAILDSSNVNVKGVRSNNFPSDNVTHGAQGDGFYIGGSTEPGSTDITLTDVSADSNVRQGLSIARGERISVNGFHFTNTSGANPGAGIDLEANALDHTLRDISISNGTISGCYFGVIFTNSCKNAAMSDVTIRDCRFNYIYLSQCERVVIDGCVLDASGGTMATSSPIVECLDGDNIVFSDNYVKGNQDDANAGAGFRVLAGQNISITDNTFEKTRTQGIGIGSSAISAAPNIIRATGNTFIDCVSSAAPANTAVMAIAGNSGSGIYPLLVNFRDNDIYDTRTGGNEADLAYSVSTSIPAATQANYRIEPGVVSGPAGLYTSGALPPLCGAVTWNPGSLADGAGETSPTVTVTGAAVGDSVTVFPPYDLQEVSHSAYVSATDTVEIRLQNESGSTVDLASGSWRVRVRKLLQA